MTGAIQNRSNGSYLLSSSNKGRNGGRKRVWLLVTTSLIASSVSGTSSFSFHTHRVFRLRQALDLIYESGSEIIVRRANLEFKVVDSGQRNEQWSYFNSMPNTANTATVSQRITLNVYCLEKWDKEKSTKGLECLEKSSPSSFSATSAFRTSIVNKPSPVDRRTTSDTASTADIVTTPVATDLSQSADLAVQRCPNFQHDEDAQMYNIRHKIKTFLYCGEGEEERPALDISTLETRNDHFDVLKDLNPRYHTTG
ncbi:hypothetical protein M436DRAFT_67790 [Aureobasidium namibiae CBS 147.97]|uniref:Uncharacterized protein n=1 Tax=Aureobasidium namibiae CBS 147.97 TaxID=1043004 RepID=A0A074WG73_9PEZI|nr:uncharacterized protein M436DRAFT_67790 [Aureobasidium namibiae CBS 147.97]KEQ68877.1 hypothetical protein M436DRAFT_67790 [Aureobasidium namibiae CBS 147.97]